MCPLSTGPLHKLFPLLGKLFLIPAAFSQCLSLVRSATQKFSLNSLVRSAPIPYIVGAPDGSVVGMYHDHNVTVILQLIVCFPHDDIVSFLFLFSHHHPLTLSLEPTWHMADTQQSL